MKTNKLLLSLAAAGALGITLALAAEAGKDRLPNNPDAAWAELEKSFRPPPQPAEWAGKTPTDEQRKAFAKFLGEQSALVAEKAKEFYTRFPDHPKAEEARSKEERFAKQAIYYGAAVESEPAESPDPKTDEKPIDPGLEQKLNTVHKRALEKRPQGLAAVLKEFESGIRGLMKEYPKEPLLWEQMMIIPANSEDTEEKKRVLTDIINSNLVSEETLARAKGMMRGLGAVGQPLDIAFTAVDGSKIDIQKMKGKVVLIDFWASWCGPCIASLPSVVDMYNRYHDKGFEIVGINMDKDPRGMQSVIRRFKMPWAQYHDGKVWGTKYAMDYNVSQIPTMWLVDKKGILRSMDAHEDMEEQVKALLAEKL